MHQRRGTVLARSGRVHLALAVPVPGTHVCDRTRERSDTRQQGNVRRRSEGMRDGRVVVFGLKVQYERRLLFGGEVVLFRYAIACGLEVGFGKRHAMK